MFLCPTPKVRRPRHKPKVQTHIDPWPKVHNTSGPGRSGPDRIQRGAAADQMVAPCGTRQPGGQQPKITAPPGVTCCRWWRRRRRPQHSDAVLWFPECPVRTVSILVIAKRRRWVHGGRRYSVYNKSVEWVVTQKVFRRHVSDCSSGGCLRKS